MLKSFKHALFPLCSEAEQAQRYDICQSLHVGAIGLALEHWPGRLVNLSSARSLRARLRSGGADKCRHLSLHWQHIDSPQRTRPPAPPLFLPSRGSTPLRSKALKLHNFQVAATSWASGSHTGSVHARTTAEWAAAGCWQSRGKPRHNGFSWDPHTS